MLTANNLFFNFLSEGLLKSHQIEKSLLSILKKGILQINGLILLAEFYDIRSIPSATLFDDIDKEIFINGFHSDDYLNCDVPLEKHWIHMILFCKSLQDYFPDNRDYSVRILLTQTEFGVNFKMYKNREIEYLVENIDTYEQGIIIFEF